MNPQSPGTEIEDVDLDPDPEETLNPTGRMPVGSEILSSAHTGLRVEEGVPDPEGMILLTVGPVGVAEEAGSPSDMPQRGNPVLTEENPVGTGMTALTGTLQSGLNDQIRETVSPRVATAR